MAAKIHVMRAERAEVAKKANSALEAAQARAQAEKRSLSAEEKAEQATFDARLGELDDDIRLESRRLERERELGGDPVPPVDPPKEPKGFGSMGEMLQAVNRAGKDPRFSDQRLFAGPSGANESVNDEGAFLVQQEYGGTLLQQTFETGILSRRTRSQPIGAGANGVKFNLLDETNRANGSRFGGIQAYWIGEADAFTGTKPKFRRLELKLQKLIGLMYVTDELLQDAVALQGFVNEWFPQEFGFKVDDAIFAGSGAGMPLGYTVCPAKVQVAKESGQPAATLIAENIEKMYARMPASSLGNAEWFINVEVWPQLFKLAHAIGTGGVPVFVPAGGISQAPFGTLLGRPITPIEQAAALGTEGDITFADLSRYMLADKGGIQTASSIHVKFTTDEMAFRWVLRTDGQPIPAAPLTPYKGTATQSPFITLQNR